MPTTTNGAPTVPPSSSHGGRCLAKLGDEAIEPDQTLSSLGVPDGEAPRLRRRSGLYHR